MSVPPRRASLVLCAPDGDVFGRLPPIEVATPWWQDAGPVVDAARRWFDVDVVVLRMLDAELPRPHGGLVTYLAEVAGPDAVGAAATAALEPFADVLAADAHRASYAVPGGPAADLAWADRVLRDRRIERTGPAGQVRTWNLSSIWRIPTSDGDAWLKVVPSFFAHEGDMLRRLQGGPVPRLIGHDGPRLLMAETPGVDRYDAGPDELVRAVSILVDLQAAWTGREDELLAMGLPDWRAGALPDLVASVVERHAAEFDGADRQALEAVVGTLDERLAAVAACGIPDTFVHGDFHPGNLRGTGVDDLTVLDWGDCGVGHPLLDTPAFIAELPDGAVAPVLDHWAAAWRRHRPGSDPARAIALLEPVAAARQAVIYQGFVDRIEAAERRHHAADIVDWLRRTAHLASAGRDALGDRGSRG